MLYTGRLLLTTLVTVFAFTPGILEAEDGTVVDQDSRQKAVAMVRSRNGLFPVSSDGVLLPSDGLTAQAVRQYLQIDIGERAPTGPVGAKYGYKAVSDAARIAVALCDVWQDAQLKAIAVAGPGTERRHEYILEPNRRGIKVLWGHAPGSEEWGEAKASDKVKRLARFVKENSPEYTFLPTPSTVLDLRPAEGQVIRIDHD